MQGQKSPERSAQPGVYVGVDVCKDWLDVYLHPVGQKLRVSNTPVGLKALKRRLAELLVELIVMEATAKFHRQAHRTLHAAGFAVAVVNPLRARLFAEAVGQLAKTDRLDARVLALMGQALEPSALAPAPEAIEALQELARARSAAKADQTALLNRRGASQTAFLKAELGRRLKVLAGHIERLDAEIERRIGADPALKRRYDIVLTIPGVGPVAAVALVIGLPELGACSAKAASLLAGLAPLARDSGARPASATSGADAPSCEPASTSPPSPRPAATRNSAKTTNASGTQAKKPRSPSPPSCESSSSSPTSSSKRIAPGSQSMLDFQHRCSPCLSLNATVCTHL